MIEIAMKLFDWVGANPDAAVLLLLASALLLIAAAPIVALTVVGYALRILAGRDRKAANE
jgi:hypothetical protein